MSWIEKVQSEYIITLGDGREFRPLWMNATKQVEYNISEFEFPELAGTLVKRGTPKGAKYSFEIYFQGDQHLEESRSFERSAADSRAWVIVHPLYGSLTVQPTGLTFDNSANNVTKITGSIIETITDENPRTFLDPVDNIKIEKEKLDSTFVNAFDVTPSPVDVNTMSSNNKKLYSLGSKISLVPEDAELYFNLFNTANAAIITASAEPLKAIRAIQAMINAPALFQVSVRSRIDLFSEQFTALRANVGGMTERSSKKNYENNGGALISSQAYAAATPIDGDYGNRDSVILAIETLLNNYNTFLTDLDLIQTPNGGEPNSYIPDASALIALNSLINLTVSSLFAIALNSRQERTIYLEDDSNLIILTHRFYGLDPSDNNMNELMVNNNIGLNEILQIKKGRKITYYI